MDNTTETAAEITHRVTQVMQKLDAMTPFPNRQTAMFYADQWAKKRQAAAPPCGGEAQAGKQYPQYSVLGRVF